MDKISEIIDDIYDPKIEDPEYQTLMRSCIKAWIRDGVERGIQLGREDCALEMCVAIKKHMNPRRKLIKLLLL